MKNLAPSAKICCFFLKTDNFIINKLLKPISHSKKNCKFNDCMLKILVLMVLFKKPKATLCCEDHKNLL